MRRLLRKIKNFFLMIIKQIKWKNNNKHNFLNLRTSNYISLNINKIKCGKYSYGTLNVEFYGSDIEQLEIGNYCSIAPNVQFLLGGNHPYTNISTFPFKAFRFQRSEQSYSKGKIVLKDDVWIGNGATILSGVTLGQGCIVGAKTVVTRDIPPYAIVVGNPGRVIKFRFEKEVIDKLIYFDFEKIKLDSIQQLYKEINVNNVDNIIASLYKEE